MENNQVEVNVEKIMEDIRRKIQMEEDLQNLPAFEDIPIRDQEPGTRTAGALPAEGTDWPRLAESLQYVNRNCTVQYYWPFQGSTIKVFLKRVVRKLAKCLLLPIVDMQNLFNTHVAHCLNGLKDAADWSIAKGNAQEKEISALREETAALREELRRTSALVEEVRGMAKVNAQGVQALETDMDCVRRLDGSIFAQGGTPDCSKYSQAGEDSIVAYIVGSLGYREDEVTYLDLGANHAKQLSNTYFFYQKGACGVLVEANPALIPELKLIRPRDVVLNRCLSTSDGDQIDFYVMNYDGLSTSDLDSAARSRAANDSVELSRVERVNTVTAGSILNDYFAQPPMLVSLDIEGGELEVLRTLDYDRFRPLILVVETIPYEKGLVLRKKNEEIVSFMAEKGYVEYAFTGINSIFVDEAQAGRINRNTPKRYCGAVDCHRLLLTNELACRMPQGISLRPGGFAFGPYITCPAGEYELEVSLQMPAGGGQVSLDVTADSGREILGHLDLTGGVNRLRFSFTEEKQGVEFVVRNGSNAGVLLQRVTLD